MPRRRRFSIRLAIALTALAVLALGAGGAGAQTLNAGEFLVNMPLPGGAGGQGEQPNCTPAIETIAMSGGTAKCTLNKVVTGDTANGTVSNATLAGQYGAGFANGTMTRTCDMNQAMTMDITFAAGAIMSGGQPKIAGGGTIVMTCTWRMVFTDEKASTLEGTMEMNASMTSSDIQASSSAGANIEMDFKVYVTKGSGLFDGYTGSGSLSQEQAMSLLGGGGGCFRRRRRLLGGGSLFSGRRCFSCGGLLRGFWRFRRGWLLRRGRGFRGDSRCWRSGFAHPAVTGEPGDGSQQAGLARTVRADDGGDLPAGCLQADGIQGPDRAVGDGEGVDDEGHAAPSSPR